MQLQKYNILAVSHDVGNDTDATDSVRPIEEVYVVRTSSLAVAIAEFARGSQ